MGKKRIGYFEAIDNIEQICSRCHLCELICAFHHHQVGNPKRSSIRVVSLGKGVDVPVACMNCEDSPCMNICPTGALHRPHPDDMVVVDRNVCIGCSMCVNACPVGAITLDVPDGVAAKCDLCGGDPQCVAYCPAKVLKLTDAEGMAKHLKKNYVKLLQVAD